MELLALLRSLLTPSEPKRGGLQITITGPQRWPPSESRSVFVKHELPEGMACRYRDVKVAGISYREEIATEFVLRGVNHRLELEREPSNVKDANAIKVIAVWEVAGQCRKAHIGYVPRETAQQIAERHKEAPLAAVPIVVFQPDCDHPTPGVRFDIYTPRAQRKRKKATTA
jgi:HIRAN domain